MTRFIAAYDTESPGACLTACDRIRAVHEQYNVPATFFITGQRLEEEGPEFRAALGGCDLFEIASHTYSHRMLRDHPFCGPAPDRSEIIKEIRLGKQLVEDTFGRACVGLRPGCGFDNGLIGDAWLLEQVVEAGFGYISSLLWGPEYSLPAQLKGPFSYASEGYPNLWEMPAHGWHENVLKGHNLTTSVQRLVAWPMPDPSLVPPGLVTSVEEEFAVNRRFIDRAIQMDLPYVSLIWHPWSLARFDPLMRMLEMTFAYLHKIGVEAASFASLWEQVRSQPDLP